MDSEVRGGGAVQSTAFGAPIGPVPTATGPPGQVPDWTPAPTPPVLVPMVAFFDAAHSTSTAFLSFTAPMQTPTDMAGITAKRTAHPDLVPTLLGSPDGTVYMFDYGASLAAYHIHIPDGYAGWIGQAGELIAPGDYFFNSL